MAVVVYRRPGCMFCSQVEELLRDNGIPFSSVDVEDRSEQERLCVHYDALAFPLVLADDRYIGGFTHVIQLHSDGRLQAALLGIPDEPRAGGATRSAIGALDGLAALGKLLRDRTETSDDG